MRSNSCIYWIIEVETFNSGNLGLCAAIWQHRSKSMCAGLACCCLGILLTTLHHIARVDIARLDNAVPD